MFNVHKSSDWRAEIVVDVLTQIPNGISRIIAEYGSHTEKEKLICVFEELAQRRISCIHIDAGSNFNEPLRLVFPKKVKDDFWFKFTISEHPPWDPDATLRLHYVGRSIADILPSKKKIFLFKLSEMELNKKIRNAYRIHMAGLMARY